MAFWQVLEGLSLRSMSNLTMKETGKRIITLIGKKGSNSFLNDFIDTFVDSRNLLVHQGRFSKEGEIEVNFLKGIVEDSIIAILKLGEMYPSREFLNDFYQQSLLTFDKLLVRQKVIGKILSSDKNSAPKSEEKK